MVFHRVMRPNDVDGMENSVDSDKSVDPDQRNSLIWVYTVCPGLLVRKLRIILPGFCDGYVQSSQTSFITRATRAGFEPATL